MKVTVAICTWNRAKLLDQTLAEMAKLRIPPGVEWELLVVNNNCTDETDAVIGKHSKNLPVRRIWEDVSGLSRARNAAIQAAHGDWIIFTDDDVLPAEEWLCSYYNAMLAAPATVAILGGAIEPWFEVAPDEELMCAMPMVRNGFCGVSPPAEFEFDESALQTPLGANFAIRLGLIEQLRFSTALGVSKNGRITGEEVLFIRGLLKRGLKGRWVPGANVKHFVGSERLSLVYLRRHLIGMGKSGVRANWPQRGAFGTIPLWAYRDCFEAFLMLGVYRLTGPRSRYLECFKRAYLGYGRISEAIKLWFWRPAAAT